MKGGIGSNVDSGLTPQQRKQAEIDAKNDGLIQQAVEKADREGPKPELIVAGQEYATTYQRLAEQEAFASGDRPSLIPLAVQVGPQYPGGFHYILSDADMDAVLAGAYCFYCLCRYPQMWAPACSVCGADRDLM